MPDDQYPAFEGGQTLTAHDLNTLRGFLHQRDRLLGRLIGFGVNCGLGGVVTGTTLTIRPGLAIDQVGEPLVLAAAQTIVLPPVASSGVFDFVAAGAGGFSVVLEATDTVAPAPDCGEAGCEGHAELHTRSVALRVVPGRITGSRFDFADEPLLDLEPMRLSLTSAPQGSYVTLRDAVVARLTNGGSPLISTVLIAKLQATSIGASDLPGVKGYKAGFLNEVFFATLDLLRVEALLELSCARVAARPGVVLGWLHQEAGAWTWDCGYRHAWEPPTGFTQALLGGTCSDPAGLFRDEVEALIAGYAPPDPPPAGTPPVTEPPVLVWCRKGEVRVGGKCLNIRYPPPKIREKWDKTWRDPRGPRWNPNPLIRVELERDTYPGYPLDFLGEGVLNVTDILGRDAEVSRTTVIDTVTALEGTPNVLVLTADAVLTTPGYQADGSLGIADTLVMTVDAQNRVVAIGRVPAGFTAKAIGTALPLATAKAGEALDAVGKQGVLLGTMATEVTGLQGEVTGLMTFQTTTMQWKGSVETTLGTLGTLVREGVETAVGAPLKQVQERIARMEGSVDVLKTRTVTGVREAGGVTRLDQEFAMGMTEFATTVSASLTTLVNADNEVTLGRHIGEVTRATANLETVAGGGDVAEIGDATVRLMGSLRTAVKAAGIEPALGKQLDTQFNAVKGLLG